MDLSAASGLLLSLAMLGVFALLTGAAFAWRRGINRRQAILMAIAALVLLGNILIIVWPVA